MAERLEVAKTAEALLAERRSGTDRASRGAKAGRPTGSRRSRPPTPRKRGSPLVFAARTTRWQRRRASAKRRRERKSSSPESKALEARQASLVYRIKTAWLMRRRRAALRRRTVSQLAGWVLKPSSPHGIRRLREFLAIRRSALFDREFYLRRNPDVKNAGMNPVLHYIEYGARAGIDPGPEFNTRRYLAEHPDVAESGVNPLYHFSARAERHRVLPAPPTPPPGPTRAPQAARPRLSQGRGGSWRLGRSAGRSTRDPRRPPGRRLSGDPDP